MANRCLLHKSKLEPFKNWLEERGWTIEQTKGDYEVLRARYSERQQPLIIYEKLDAKEHLSITDKDANIVRAFLYESGLRGNYQCR